MANFACETCGLELSSKHALEAHVNRKYKCVPPGQVQYECRTCDKQFTRKNLLDQHLRTDKHRQVVAALLEYSAPSLVRPVRTRDFPEWEPEVGHRWLALARMQQTGEYPMPPSV